MYVNYHMGWKTTMLYLDVCEGIEVNFGDFVWFMCVFGFIFVYITECS